jgi:hypothetical protein
VKFIATLEIRNSQEIYGRERNEEYAVKSVGFGLLKILSGKF